MPRYADGTEAKVNDHVHGRIAGHDYPITGIVHHFENAPDHDTVISFLIAGEVSTPGDVHHATVEKFAAARDLLPTGHPLFSHKKEVVDR